MFAFPALKRIQIEGNNIMNILLKCGYPDRTEIYYGSAFPGGNMFLNDMVSIGNDSRILSSKRVSLKNKLPDHPIPIMFEDKGNG